MRVPGRRALGLLFPLLGVASPAVADVLWNEATQGDLSGNRLAPTQIDIGAGTHSLLATTGAGDVDYLSITIPDGAEFTELWLTSYQGGDGLAFIGMCEGPTFFIAPNEPPTAMLGWAHFGPGAGHVGTDILDDIGWGSGAIGFETPLPAGTYSFWLQQLGAAVTYQLDFVIVPEPSSGAGVFAAAMAALAARRFRR